jgi:hypothetical protein
MLGSAAANFVVGVHRDKNDENDQLSSERKLDEECVAKFFFDCRAFRCVNNQDRQLVR